MRLRRPETPSVPQHTGTFVPRNRVRGAEADRGQCSGTLVVGQDLVRDKQSGAQVAASMATVTQ